ncbi:MAG: bifunctional DNA primase/helicase [Bacteroidota bacterium]
MFHDHNIQLPPTATGEIRTTCPKCSYTRQKKNEKCLSVHVEKDLWYCHHCQWKGSLHPSPENPLNPTPSTTNTQNPGLVHTTHILTPHTSIQLRPFTPAEQSYWRQYRISPQLLQRFNVRAVRAYSSLSRLKQPYTIRSSESQPIFAYQVQDLASSQPSYKIYAPKSKVRFRWLGTKPQGYLFGLDQLPASGKQLILTGGEKDVLTLTYLGYPAISLNSETAQFPKDILTQLRARFKQIAILYDSDPTGHKMAQKLATQHQLQFLQLPKMSPPHKDISDYIAYGYDLQSLIESLSVHTPFTVSPAPMAPPAHIPNLETSSIQHPAPKTIEPMYTLRQLLQDTPRQEHLYLGIPPVSFGYVVGPPKSGKTTYCEGLAFSIAAGLDTYLGHPLHAPHPTVIFLSMEEFWRNRMERNEQQIQRIIDQQGEAWIRNVHMASENFPPNLVTDSDWQLIEAAIARIKPSVVFIDSLSRCYTGAIEDSRIAKQLTTRLRALVQKYQICLILIHHTPKQIGRPLTIDSIAGSRVLAQEADFAIGISQTLSKQRYLKPIFYRYAQEDEEVQCFQFTDDLWIQPTETTTEALLLTPPEDGHTYDSRNEVWDYIQTYCQEHDHITTQQLIQVFVQTGEIGKASLHRYLKFWQERGKLEKMGHGKYQIFK